LVTFQEQPGDSFDLVRSGLRLKDSVARQSLHPDHLAYRLIDAAIDAYFPLLENIGDLLDKLDDPEAIHAYTPRFFGAAHGATRVALAAKGGVAAARRDQLVAI